MQRATKAVPGRTLPVGARSTTTQPRRDSSPQPSVASVHTMAKAVEQMKVPFSMCPVSPASPRNLMQVHNARIHTVQIDGENAIASKWADRYRKIQTQKLLAAMKLKSLESETSKPISPRIESSMVASRLTFGSKLTQAEREFVLGTLETMRRPTLLEPMSRSPRGRLPPHYGRTLHTDAAPYYGIDLRSG